MANLYHEPFGEPVKGREKLLERLWDHDNSYSYVNPKDGSEAYFDLRKGLHSVKTISVKKMGIEFNISNFPSSTKSVILVRWGMRIKPYNRISSFEYYDWVILSIFDADSELWL